MPPDGEDDQLYAHVGARVRALRKARGLTMQDVVDRGLVGDEAHPSDLSAETCAPISRR